MSRKSRPQLSREAKKRKRQENQRRREEDLIQDTTAVMTCMTEATNDLTYQCQDRLDMLRVELPLAKLVRQFWNGRPGNAEIFIQLLDDLVAEYERSQQALAALESRLSAFSQSLATGDKHEHLEPPEAYRDRVRKCLFPDQAPPT
jgi:hypothetical protein